MKELELKKFFEGWTEEELSTFEKKLCTPPPDESKMEWLKELKPTKEIKEETK